MKPILFNTEMVQAILNNKKTVTRRKIKLDLGLADIDKNDNGYLMIPDTDGDYHKAEDYCKYQVGDILYVRETFCPNYFDEFVSNKLKCAYRADWNPKLINGDIPEPKWKPSIHMPKGLARIFLKVIDLRVERIQDITEIQVIKEGFNSKFDMETDTFYPEGYFFVEAWNEIYGDWESNPFVWAIEFERINSYTLQVN